MTKLFETISSQRGEQYAEKDIVTSEMDEQWQADEAVRCMIMMIQAVAGRSSSPANFPTLVASAAPEMGVEDFDLEAVTALKETAVVE